MSARRSKVRPHRFGILDRDSYGFLFSDQSHGVDGELHHGVQLGGNNTVGAGVLNFRRLEQVVDDVDQGFGVSAEFPDGRRGRIVRRQSPLEDLKASVQHRQGSAQFMARVSHEGSLDAQRFPQRPHRSTGDVPAQSTGQDDEDNPKNDRGAQDVFGAHVEVIGIRDRLEKLLRFDLRNDEQEDGEHDSKHDDRTRHGDLHADSP